MSEDRVVGADRVLLVLSELGRHVSGISLDELAAKLDIPKSSAHRALSTLRKRGYAAQDQRGHYLLGEELLRLAFSYQDARPESEQVAPVLRALSTLFGETAHYAVLDGADVVYRAKSDALSGGMKLTSVVGGRNPAHATGVGKLLLADRYPSKDALADWIGGRQLLARTPHSLTELDELHRECEEIRGRGYALDREESELGVVCIAFPVSLTPSGRIDGAISVSAVAVRTPLELLIARADEVRQVLGPLATSFA